MSPPVLDATAGPRMMWFDPADARAVYVDERSETVTLCDGRTVTIEPDVQADFRSLPFRDATFHHVVFDPPHLERVGKTSWTRAKYGALFPTWRDDLAAGFAECFRVLKPGGNTAQPPTTDTKRRNHAPNNVQAPPPQERVHHLVNSG